jgi:hypothetical protein
MRTLNNRIERHAQATPLRSWTGRAALSRVTDSALSTLVTAGTFKTRVSQARGFAPGGRRARGDNTQRSERGGDDSRPRHGPEPM